MNAISTKLAPAAIGPYSQGIAAEGLIFVSGQLPIDPATGTFAEGDISARTAQSLKNIAAILEAEGSSLDKVVKTSIFVTDLSQFSVVNAAYGEFFRNIPPARSCVQVAALPKGADIEIEAIAVR